MREEDWVFVIIPISIGATAGAICGGWLGKTLDLTLLGIIGGGLLGLICALLLSMKVYGWVIEDLEEEWQQERMERGDSNEANRNLDRK